LALKRLKRNEHEHRRNIAWGALGLLSFIFLIVYLRWVGTPEDQKKDRPPEVPNGEERQKAETVD
jgi:hypothetical protein